MFSSNTSAVSADAVFVEEVFQTHLYTGNGSTQTITNGIDLAGKGGLVWFKARNSGTWNNLADTSRGLNKWIYTNDTTGQLTGSSNSLTAFNSNGFSLGADSDGVVNFLNNTYASWTFRKQPKFFDVVTWTGNGTNPRQIAHNLGSVPGCIIVKSTTRAENWTVYHRSLGNAARMALNTTDAQVTGTGVWASTTPTSTYFTVSADNLVNFNGDGYVAYLFAHDAGGFGLTGTDNVISCGSYVGTSANFVDVNLGYEPQWFMVKKADATGPWYIIDNMRDMSHSGTSNLQANASNAEQATVPQVIPSATGISLGYSGGGSGYNTNGVTYIYIAIRRGPMKTPTSGTSVFDDLSRFGNATVGAATVVGFPADMVLNKRSSDPATWVQMDRLRGNPLVLFPSATDAEFDLVGAGLPSTNGFTGPNQNSYYWPAGGSNYNGLSNYASYFFRRAPGFFDVVCFTAGTSTNRRVDHNLTTPPQLILLKARNVSQSWYAYSETLGINGILYPNQNWAPGTVTNAWGSSAPTATNFGINEPTFASAGDTYVAYLFASCPGVSKVGSYTGNGSSQTINCGFTGGARFVMVKRTDSTGNWMVVDTARGLVSASDPTLYLNSTAAEVTGVDWLDPDSSGFIVNQESTMNANVNGGTYIFLAIA